MQQQGISISQEELQRKNPDAVIGRPHIARHLVDIGCVKHYQQAFDKYLAYGRPFYLPKKALDLSYAIGVIHDCSGYAVIAHPMSLCLSWKNMQVRIPEFKEQGINGLEAYHSTCSPVHCQRLKELAQAHGLAISGGSDYHGQQTKKLGVLGHYDYGRKKIPLEVLDIMYKKQLVSKNPPAETARTCGNPGPV